jgi:hypothetical protein
MKSECELGKDRLNRSRVKHEPRDSYVHMSLNDAKQNVVNSLTNTEKERNL